MVYITSKNNWTMGCVYSQKSCDNDSNIFDVMNIDHEGNLVAPGKLKITKSYIIFEQNKSVFEWPFRCLRRYGYDNEIFSFESGRRCKTGPGIYAFKCNKAAQLFNLVQTNIQTQITTNNEDIGLRGLSVNIHNDRTTTSPLETNYLDPIAAKSNGTLVSAFAHSHQNDRLNSIGSSSGPMSPRATVGSPSPPPVMPLHLPLPPPVLHVHPSSYVNEEVCSTAAAGDSEHNNNKNVVRRSIQRSQTVSSSTSSNVFPSMEQVSDQVSSGDVWMTSQNYSAVPSQSSVPSYMNVDLGSDASPLSPSYNACNILSPKEEGAAMGTPTATYSSEAGNNCSRTYMNISPEQESGELVLSAAKFRPPALSIPPMSSSQLEEDAKHCYANLEASEVEILKKRNSGVFIDKLPSHLQTPPPISNAGIREVKYAVLNLDKKIPSWQPTTAGTRLSITTTEATTMPGAAMTSTSTSTTTATTTIPAAAAATPMTAANTTATAMTTAAATTTASLLTANELTESYSSLPRQNGYVTIDFNKTAALSHSANSNLISDIDEGSRKTRHNSTISELIGS